MDISVKPLSLRLGGDSWVLFQTRCMDKRFIPFQDKVFSRDFNTCQYCGFQATTHQYVVNVDGDYHRNVMSNMATACCFCMQCSFLEQVGRMEYGDASVIYFPELSQNEINAICHVTFCAMSYASAYSEESQNIYNVLKLRSKVVEKTLGERMSMPSHMGQILIDTPLDGRDSIVYKLLSDLRLLPNYTAYQDQIQDWGQIALDQMA